MDGQIRDIKKIKMKILKGLIPVIIVALGFGIGKYLFANQPKATRSRPKQLATLVEVRPVERKSITVNITAMGPVIPSRIIELSSRVGGQVIATSGEFIPGGVFKKGDVILNLDPEDLNLVVRKSLSIIDREKADLMLEMGQQDVAREELKLMQELNSGKKIEDTALALRMPYLEQAKAELETAKIDLEKAKVDLRRTVVNAPFNCMIQEKTVELGSVVSSRSKLATLVDTDTFWVEAKVPVDRLKWIKFPNKSLSTASEALIITQSGLRKKGSVIRLLGDLNVQSHMARVLIEVPDPLGIKSKNPAERLLIGSHVTINIEGRIIEDTIRLPRSAVREDNTVWLADSGKLEIKKVYPVWYDNDSIYIKDGLSEEDKIIISELSAPVKGMRIRTSDKKPAAIRRKIAENKLKP